MDGDAVAKATTGFPYTTTSELAFLYHRTNSVAETRQVPQQQSSHPPSTSGSLFRNGPRRRVDSTGSSDSHVAGASLYNLASARCSQTSVLSSSSTHSAYSQLKQSLPRLWRRGDSKGRCEIEGWDMSRPSSSNEHYTSFLPHSSASDSGDVEALDDVSSHDEDDEAEHKSWTLPQKHRLGSSHASKSVAGAAVLTTSALQRSSSSSQMLHRPRKDPAHRARPAEKVAHQRSLSSISYTLSEQRCEPVRTNTAAQSTSDVNEPTIPVPTTAASSAQPKSKTNETRGASEDRTRRAPSRVDMSPSEAIANPKPKTEQPRGISKLKKAAHRALARVNQQHIPIRHRRTHSGSSSTGWDEENHSVTASREQPGNVEVARDPKPERKPQPRDEFAAFELGKKRSQQDKQLDKQKERQIRRGLVERMSGSSHEVLNEASRSGSGTASKQTTSGSSTSSHTRSCMRRARQRQCNVHDPNLVAPALYQSLLAEDDVKSDRERGMPCTCHLAPGREGDWTRETPSRAGKSSSGKSREHQRSRSSSLADGLHSSMMQGKAHHSRHGYAMPEVPKVVVPSHLVEINADGQYRHGRYVEGGGDASPIPRDEANVLRSVINTEGPAAFPPRTRSLHRVRRQERQAAENVVPA